ncbi:hypothetical protein [Burkholderia sp. WAC0059]|uniref:hypothetical protein n=1 Tax=Burkholderia sp. WAC0059 TaxID=2066022 RepID=UPI0011AFBCB0|nr:hypothetical protein [Burkholderia sp. WAC0059]
MTSFFRIRFAAGAALATVSGTEVIIGDELECRFKLRCIPRNRARDRAPEWMVEALGDPAPAGSTDNRVVVTETA